MTSYKVEKTSRAVITVRFDDIASGWEWWVLLRSDAHHDAPACDREMEEEHLAKAKERHALIFDFGDLFDAMQGKFDPRRNFDDVRPEDVGVDYYDRIVKHAADFYAPYAEDWVMFGRGNHEIAVLDKCNTDITSQLSALLNVNLPEGRKTMVGGYGGWVRFMFNVQKTVKQSINMKYFHGSGGAAPVTQGVIQTNRQQVYLPDADIVVNGHTHTSFDVGLPRERLTMAGNVDHDIVRHLRIPGYKNAYGDGTSGWDVERGMSPKPLGCFWIRFFYNGEQKRKGARKYIRTEFIQDIH